MQCIFQHRYSFARYLQIYLTKVMVKNKRNVQQRQPIQYKVVAATQQPSYIRQAVKLDESPPAMSVSPPKHVPLPEISRVPELAFEFFIMVFSLVSLGLQYLNLYRTAFWIPNSFTKNAMHFHLIDFGLVLFVTVLMSRRFVWSIIKFFLTKSFQPTFCRIGILVTRSIYLIILIGLSVYSILMVKSQMNLIRIIVLFYPFTFYFFKFRLDPSSFLEMIPIPSQQDEKNRITKNGKKTQCLARVIQHTCSNTVESIRNEVNFLREDFNKRIAQAIFQTIMIVHYTAVVPCIFAPPSLMYDCTWVKFHTIFVGTTTFTWHLIFCFPAKYCDVLHRSTMHLGGWAKLDCRASQAPFNVWSPTVLWPQGAHVKYVKDFYRAEGFTNAAEPGNTSHARIFTLFHEPWRLQLCIVTIHSVLCVLNLVFLITLHQWQQLIASAFVLSTSFAALFFILRDYLILRKVYKFEHMYQSKANS